MANKKSSGGPLAVNEVTDIPPMFHSFSQERAFSHCISCNINLLDNNIQYLIEKAFRRYPGFDTQDVIFEYAMCLPCAERMRKEMSVESMRNIQQFFDERVDFYGRRQELLYEHGLNHEAWLDRCIVTGRPKSELQEYQVYGHCQGDRFLFSYLPYLISNEAVEMMSELLSEKTRGEIDRFIDDNFGLPPELRQPIKDHPFVLL